MGFLQNLLSKETRKVISNVVDNVVDGALKNMSGTQAESIREAVRPTSQTPRKAAWNDKATYGKGGTAEQEVRRRIEKIINEEWQGYHLVYNRIPEEFHAPMGARAYDMLLMRDDVPVAAIMFLHGHNEYAKRAVKDARQRCQEHGVAYMNFMVYMANRPEYISQRFKKEITS